VTFELSKWYSVVTVQTAVLSDWLNPRELRQTERLIGQGRRRVSPSQERGGDPHRPRTAQLAGRGKGDVPRWPSYVSKRLPYPCGFRAPREVIAV
jgi:hypothetical protein